MSDDDFDLERLRKVWTDLAQPPLDPGVIDALRREVHRGSRRLRREVVLECMATLLGAAFFTWLALGSDGRASVAYALLAAGVLLGQAWLVMLRRDVWRARSESPAEFLSLQLRRSRLRGRLAALGMVTGPFGVAVGFALQRVAPSAAAGELFDRVGPLATGAIVVGFFALLVYGASTWRRERRVQARIESQIQELDE